MDIAITVIVCFIVLVFVFFIIFSYILFNIVIRNDTNKNLIFKNNTDEEEKNEYFECCIYSFWGVLFDAAWHERRSSDDVALCCVDTGS